MLLDVHLERNGEEIRRGDVLTKKGGEIFIGCEFDPDIQGSLFLDVTDNGVELEVLFCFGGLQHLETHGALASVVESDLLSVDVTQEAYLEIIFLALDADWYLDAFALETDGDRRGVQTVLCD